MPSKPSRAMPLLVALFFSGAGSAWPQAPAPAESPTAPLPPVPSGMTVKQADIIGQVFIASEAEQEQEKPAPNVRIRVLPLDDDQVLREAYTDKEGFYTLQKLDVGRYRLYVSSLKLILTVEPGEQAATERPKVVIVIIPKQMAKTP